MDLTKTTTTTNATSAVGKAMAINYVITKENGAKNKRISAQFDKDSKRIGYANRDMEGKLYLGIEDASISISETKQLLTQVLNDIDEIVKAE